MRRISTYSNELKGAKGNFNQPARFDMSRGFLGITQKTEAGIDRVLLSPGQVRALVAFVQKSKAHDQH